MIGEGGVWSERGERGVVREREKESSFNFRARVRQTFDKGFFC